MSLEASPLLALDANATIADARALHAQAARPKVFIKIPGTPECLPAFADHGQVATLMAADQLGANPGPRTAEEPDR